MPRALHRIDSPNMNSIEKQAPLSCEESKGKVLSILICAGLVLFAASQPVGAAEPARFLRFQKGEMIAHGLLEGDQVRQLAGDLFGHWSKTQTRFP